MKNQVVKKRYSVHCLPKSVKVFSQTEVKNECEYLLTKCKLSKLWRMDSGLSLEDFESKLGIDPNDPDRYIKSYHALFRISLSFSAHNFLYMCNQIDPENQKLCTMKSNFQLQFLEKIEYESSIFNLEKPVKIFEGCENAILNSSTITDAAKRDFEVYTMTMHLLASIDKKCPSGVSDPEVLDALVKFRLGLFLALRDFGAKYTAQDEERNCNKLASTLSRLLEQHKPKLKYDSELVTLCVSFIDYIYQLLNRPSPFRPYGLFKEGNAIVEYSLEYSQKNGEFTHKI